MIWSLNSTSFCPKTPSSILSTQLLCHSPAQKPSGCCRRICRMKPKLLSLTSVFPHDLLPTPILPLPLSSSATFLYINHVFFFFLVLWHLGLADPRGTAPPGANQFLEMLNDEPLSAPFKGRAINPEPTLPTTSSIGLSHLGLLFLCPKHPRAKYQTTRNDLCALEPTEIIQICQSQACSLYLAHFFPWKPQKKLLLMFSSTPSASWPTLSLPCVAPCGMACHLLLGPVSITIFSMAVLS